MLQVPVTKCQIQKCPKYWCQRMPLPKMPENIKVFAKEFPNMLLSMMPKNIKIFAREFPNFRKIFLEFKCCALQQQNTRARYFQIHK